MAGQIVYVAQLDTTGFPVPHNRADGQQSDLTDRLRTEGITPKTEIKIVVGRVGMPDVHFTGTVNCWDGKEWMVGYWGIPGYALKERGYRAGETVGVVVAKRN